uniref:Putative secreted peptide n=1 Tax=Anopheles braziliensis TaxID=58242 RepID=A0A2M3ZSA7_9DIPT
MMMPLLLLLPLSIVGASFRSVLVASWWRPGRRRLFRARQTINSLPSDLGSGHYQVQKPSCCFVEERFPFPRCVVFVG